MNALHGNPTDRRDEINYKDVDFWRSKQLVTHEAGRSWSPGWRYAFGVIYQISGINSATRTGANRRVIMNVRW